MEWETIVIITCLTLGASRHPLCHRHRENGTGEGAVAVCARAVTLLVDWQVEDLVCVLHRVCLRNHANSA